MCTAPTGSAFRLKQSTTCANQNIQTTYTNNCFQTGSNTASIYNAGVRGWNLTTYNNAQCTGTGTVATSSGPYSTCTGGFTYAYLGSTYFTTYTYTDSACKNMVTASATIQISNIPPFWTNCTSSSVAGQWTVKSTDDFPPFNNAPLSGTWIFTNSSSVPGCMAGKVTFVALYQANTCLGPNDGGSIYTYTTTTITQDSCPVSIGGRYYTIGCQSGIGGFDYWAVTTGSSSNGGSEMKWISTMTILIVAWIALV
jgi:hypothetical protein